MLLVGITGRSGSGKTSLSSYYASLGCPVMDGDQVSRQVLAPGAPCLAELARAFGPEVIAADGSLLRRALADKAFASPKGTAALNSITHPWILKATEAAMAEAAAAGHGLFFFDGAAIIGSSFQKRCDKIILVVSNPRLSMSRIILRDGISKTSAARRLEAQLPEETLRAAADYVLENNHSLEALCEKGDAVLEELLRLANTKQRGEGP